MSINNLLFTVQNMAPAMLGIGAGKTQNYSQLAEMTSLLGTDDATSLSSSSAAGGDTVSLTYKNIGQKVVTDMASITAQTIKEYPDLDKNYVIAIVDDGVNREARVYRRSDILDNFDGPAAEKETLKKQLDANPLMVFNSANGLPDTASDKGSQALAANLNSFLKTNAKTLSILDKAGYDPFADLMGSSNQKKMLASYAAVLLTDDDGE